MFNRQFSIVIFSLVFLTSCSFNSTFFAVEKQDLNTEIADLNYDEIYLESVDGVEIQCLFFKPEVQVLGTIFFFHGSGDNIASWSSYAEHLVKEGFQVFMMEYRGFGKDFGKATHKNVLNDAETAFKYLTNLESVRGNKVIMLGQSYGGQIAINLTSKHQDKVGALVVEGTFTSFNEEVVSQVPFIIKPFLTLFTTSAYKAKHLIKTINGIPILIIHSTEDTAVPFKMGQQLYTNANSPKHFWAIQGEHNHGLEDYTQEYIEKIKMLITEKASNLK